MNAKIKQKNANIELLRVISCVMVIVLHALRMREEINNNLEDGIRTLVMPAVGIFWLITGYFFFHNKKPYRVRVIKTIKEILLPTLIVIFISNLLHPWFDGTASIMSCITKPEINMKKMLGGIFIWDAANIPMSSHLWYVFAYLRLVVWFPLIQFICKNQPTENKIRPAFLLLFFVRTCFYDLQFVLFPLIGIDYEIQFYLPFDVNIFYVLAGYELRLLLEKEAQEKKENTKSSFIVAWIVLIVSYLLAYIAVKVSRHLELNASYFTSIKATFVILQAVSIFYIIMKVKLRFVISNIVIYLGEKTFLVYLIHYAVLKRLVINDSLKRILGNCSPVIYFLAYAILCMIISFMIISLYSEMKKMILRLLRKMKGKDINVE